LAKKELTTFDEFRQARLGDTGLIVVADVARPAIAHKLNGPCISADKFKTKVLLGENSTGKYYWVDSFPTAAMELKASACKICKPLRVEKDIRRS
jgi:hypothetical protein